MGNPVNLENKHDIFLSYRRDGGDTMAILLRDKLIAKGYSVFLDIDNLDRGNFEKRIPKVIENCKDFVLICSPNSLDRCVNDGDWVRREILLAMCNGKNIIPIMLKGFKFPDNLPDDIKSVNKHNGVSAGSHEYFDAAIDRMGSKFLISKPVNALKSKDDLKKCENCGEEVPAKDKVCDQCGTPFEKKCDNCGTTLRGKAKFCSQCGVSLEVENKALHVTNKPNKTTTYNSVKVRDIIQFGAYDWQILDVDYQKGQALLITRNIVEQRAYHLNDESINWADCDLRKYLNGKFLNSNNFNLSFSFSSKDREKIVPVLNKNLDNQCYETNGGVDTTDSIFLLSIDEAKKYFKDNNDRTTKTIKGLNSWWWLRSPGLDGIFAAYVYVDGKLGVSGSRIGGSGGVRPAMWIRLD